MSLIDHLHVVDGTVKAIDAAAVLRALHELLHTKFCLEMGPGERENNSGRIWRASRGWMRLSTSQHSELFIQRVFSDKSWDAVFTVKEGTLSFIKTSQQARVFVSIEQLFRTIEEIVGRTFLLICC